MEDRIGGVGRFVKEVFTQKNQFLLGKQNDSSLQLSLMSH